MRLDLSKNYDLTKATSYFEKLVEKGAKIELKEVREKRTIRQNAYLHVLFSLCAVEWGYTLEETKTLLKRSCGFMVYESNGNKFLKSTSKLDSGELTKFIDWIRDFSGTQGLYLPTSEEYLSEQFHIDREVQKVNNHL